MVTPLQRLCHHESGHALAALAVGAKVLKLDMTIGGGTAGGCCTWIPCRNRSDQLAVLVSGVVADRMYQLKTSHRDNGVTIKDEDEAAVRKLLPYWCRDLDQIDDVLDVEVAQIKACKILEPRWPEVQALAGGLLDKIELGENEILEIVGRARSDALLQKIEKMRAKYPVPAGDADHETLEVVHFCLGVCAVMPLHLSLSKDEYHLIIDACEDVGPPGGEAAVGRVLREIKYRRAKLRTPTGGLKSRPNSAARPSARPRRSYSPVRRMVKSS